MDYLNKLANYKSSIILFFSIIFLCLIGKLIGKENLFQYDSISGPGKRYSIGVFEKFESQSEGSMEAFFYVKINNKYYDGSFPLIDDWSRNLVKGSKILYKFDINDPDNGKVIYEYKIDKNKKIGKIFKYPPRFNGNHN